jgi:hypothetical protein
MAFCFPFLTILFGTPLVVVAWIPLAGLPIGGGGGGSGFTEGGDEGSLEFDSSLDVGTGKEANSACAYSRTDSSELTGDEGEAEQSRQ